MFPTKTVLPSLVSRALLRPPRGLVGRELERGWFFALDSTVFSLIAPDSSRGTVFLSTTSNWGTAAS